MAREGAREFDKARLVRDGEKGARDFTLIDRHGMDVLPEGNLRRAYHTSSGGETLDRAPRTASLQARLNLRA
ncbi:hypothetical protein SS37A_34630 [Methylocystis iwaonis]|uniref:Uncharacterized protein n=1 Tax=Methylocystis iwaonis TaxID=2885079 RepID=A0ABM8ED44_9HYPH|nr:hypothetical protein SS37A_34630 [Methylocystis iwaonis]